MMETYFETINCLEGEAQNLSFHEKRMAKAVGLNFNLSEYIYVPNDEQLRCKVIYNEEGISSVEFFPYTKREIQSFRVLEDNTINYSKKFLNRDALDELYSKREGADEIIIIKDGLVTDTSIANIAIFDGSNWITPKKPLLEGTTRDRLLQEEQIFEKDITVQMLQNAKALALMNAMIGFDERKDYKFFL